MNKKMVVFLLIITSYISVLCAQENILSVFEKSYTEEKLELKKWVGKIRSKSSRRSSRRKFECHKFYS